VGNFPLVGNFIHAVGSSFWFGAVEIILSFTPISKKVNLIRVTNLTFKN